MWDFLFSCKLFLESQLFAKNEPWVTLIKASRRIIYDLIDLSFLHIHRH